MMIISVCKFNVHSFDDGRRSGHCKGHIEFADSQLGVAVALEHKLLPANDLHAFLRSVALMYCF